MESSNAGNVSVNNIVNDTDFVSVDCGSQKQNSTVEIPHDTDVTSKIEFINGDFNYVVEFTTKNIGFDLINIKCTHREEFYCWSFTTSDVIKTSNLLTKQNKDSGSLNISIKPEMLYNILSAYKNNTLDKIYQIKFPVSFDSHESTITIELTTVLPMMDSYRDVKFIVLDPKKIDEVERCSLKFMRLNHLNEQKNQENILKINKEMEEIRVTQDAFSEYVRTTYAKTDDLSEDPTEEEKEIEFLAQFKKFLSKPENVKILINVLEPTFILEEDMNNFVTKSECVSKEVYTADKVTFATKTDLDKYTLKPV
ncbi:hypothetical protein QLL95_gp1306 [Cotonvirus japonicus]|uniref:Proliferating cell nuclear antigen n=1 Tax=Cotonvirus japonicus TaxID=2811091 RepID=A0ABM7NRU9_9VIRU|nr:hypothetical protein QLL95_gp1306 [Cotonvirus japonicus]BCS82817.1 hypothetical protein [Cotonvirus japonicus]